MNSLRRLLPLTLVGFALFLSAETPSPHPGPAAVAKTPPSSSTDQPPPATYNYYGTFNVIPKSNPDPSTRNHDSRSETLVTAFTGALVLTSLLQWCTIRRQAKIMTVQYNQSVNLINWNCSGRIRDDGTLRIWAEFQNSSDYQITFTGSITVEGQKQDFKDDEYLSPKYSKPVAFNIPVADNLYGINPSVSGHITYTRNQITKEQVSVRWKGTVEYTRWEKDKTWHFNLAQLKTEYKPMHKRRFRFLSFHVPQI
jgi:hypothetical protein